MNWKNLERKVAESLGGERVSRGADFGESAPDVEHDVFSVECKYRKNISKFLHESLKQAQGYDDSKIPIVVLKERMQRGEYVLMQFDDFVKVWRGDTGGKT